MASMKMGNERAFPLPPPDFSSLRRKVLELYRLGLYREALDLALQARGHFPTKESDIAFWIACLLSRLGETEKALSTLAEALDQGHWWGERLLLHDPDLEPLRDRPEFARILAVSKQRQEKAQAKAEPLLVVRPPKGGRGAKGLVITLHWYMGTAEEFAKYWETSFWRFPSPRKWWARGALGGITGIWRARSSPPTGKRSDVHTRLSKAA